MGGLSGRFLRNVHQIDGDCEEAVVPADLAADIQRFVDGPLAAAGLAIPEATRRALEAAPTEQGFRVRLWVPVGDDGGLIREAVVDVRLSRKPHPEGGTGDQTRTLDNGMIKQS